MIKFDLIKNVLIMAFLNSLIITSLVQKIKEGFNIKCSNSCIIISLAISIIIGTLFSLSFSDLEFLPSIWSSIFSFIGADLLYQILENKLFKSLGTIKNEKNIN